MASPKMDLRDKIIQTEKINEIAGDVLDDENATESDLREALQEIADLTEENAVIYFDYDNWDCSTEPFDNDEQEQDEAA